VGDGKWPVRDARVKRSGVIWMPGKPAPQRIVQGVALARSEQQIIAWLAV
jgi:hypothetical protein